MADVVFGIFLGVMGCIGTVMFGFIAYAAIHDIASNAAREAVKEAMNPAPAEQEVEE